MVQLFHLSEEYIKRRTVATEHWKKYQRQQHEIEHSKNHLHPTQLKSNIHAIKKKKGKKKLVHWWVQQLQPDQKITQIIKCQSK
jgi:DNA-directed RNA polymerase subunit M/transcription elongation factor TFIIS